MDVQELKTEVSKIEPLQDRNRDEWESSISSRDCDVKYDYALARALESYAKKLPILRQYILDTEGDEYLSDIRQQAIEKVDRILDKAGCCIKEQELRSKRLVSRKPHHTTYYIDYGGGNDSNTGLSTGQAWKTLAKYTSSTVRTAGDIALLRANVTWTPSAIVNFDEDGTKDAPIYMIGCDSVTNDPWGDGSDVKPIIDFQDLSRYLSFNTDDWWWLKRLDIQKCGASTGAVFINNSNYWTLEDSKVSDGLNSTIEGLQFSGNYVLRRIYGCEFENTGGTAIFANSGNYEIRNTIINPGTGAGCYEGIYCLGGKIDFHSVQFASDGQTFTRSQIYAVQGFRINGDAVTCGVTTDIVFQTPFAGAYVQMGGWPDSDGAYYRDRYGVITKTTTSPRTGGSQSMAKMEPTSEVGLYAPLTLGNPSTGFTPVWVGAGSYTATVYARTGSAWDTALAAGECYLKCSYLDHATNNTRTFVQSTETITNDGAWTAFTCAISPAAEGWVFFWFCLAEYEDDTEYIEVDVLPEIG